MHRDANDVSQQVDSAIAEFLDAAKRGAAPSVDAFIKAHRDIEPELREFFADQLALSKLAGRFAGDTAAVGGTDSAAGSAMRRRLPFSGPQTFGNFELVEEIARGGMGVVYKAKQSTPNRIVALKMILAGQLASEADVDRFISEAHAAAGLDHPHIVPIHEVGEWQGQHYYTMAFIEGRSLAQKIFDGPLPAKEAAAIVRDAALAVEYAHQCGVVHRDLKPANILLDAVGRVRVADFGLAKRQTTETGLTRTGELLGTPSFMSPEQVRGDSKAIGPSADVYALGATLYALITGRPPFQAATTVDTLKQVLESDPVLPRQLDASIPRDVESIVLKCLDKERSRRYETANALAADLQRFLAGESVEARPATRVYRLQKFIRRHRAGVLASVAVLAALSLGLALAAVNYRRARTEATRSDQVAQFLKGTLAAAGPSVARGQDATLLREILAETADRVDKELREQPEVQGDLWYTLASTYEDISDDERGRGMFQSAAESYRAAFGDEHPKRARALVRLGAMQSMTGNVVEGRKNAQLGLDIARRCGDSAVLAECLYYRALAGRRYLASGPAALEDVPLLRESVALYRQSDNDPLALITALSRLAFSTPDVDEAENLSRESIALAHQKLPADHPAFADLLSDLGGILLDCGKIEEAEETLRKSDAMKRKYHAPANAAHKSTRTRLVEALALRGKWEEAELLLRESIDTSTATPDSHNLYRILFVRLLASQGRFPEALDECQRFIETAPEKWKPQILRCCILLQANQIDECRRRCHELLQNDDETSKDCVAKLACLLPMEGVDLQRAYQWANEAAESGDLKLSEVGDVNRSLAEALIDYRQNRYASAVEWANRAVERGAYGAYLAQAEFIRALALTRLGQTSAAQKALTQGNALLQAPHVEYLSHHNWGGMGEWTIADLLRREAEQLVDSSPSGESSNRGSLHSSYTLDAAS